jgi:hypothetical protein
MAAFLRKVVSVHEFLASVRALGSFAKLREDQCRSLLKAAATLPPLNVQTCAAALRALQSAADVWTEEQLLQLRECVADKLQSADDVDADASAPAPPGSSKERKAGQDYTNLVYHLLQTHYEGLRGDPAAGLQAITCHLSALGLQNPTEQTLAVLATLVGWQRYQAQGLVLEEGFEALRQLKPKIRKLLALADMRPAGGDWIHVLPRDVEELPEAVRAAAYSQALPQADAAFPPAEILRTARMLPLRRTNALVSAPKVACPAPCSGEALASNPLLQAFQLLFAGQQATQAAQPLQLRFASRAEPAEPAGPQAAPLALLPPAPTPRASASGSDPKQGADDGQKAGGEARQQEELLGMLPAPLEDAPAGPVPAGSAEQATVPQQLHSLSHQLDRKVDVSLPDPSVQAGVLRRPAAAKRPASSKQPPDLEPPKPAAGSTPGEQTLKRKGEQKQQGGKKAKLTPGSAEELKARVAAGVPRKTLEGYAEGCSRCRSRPYCTSSCWRLRGFTVP